jgi:tetratricopeptide (TPR) repeat protein
MDDLRTAEASFRAAGAMCPGAEAETGLGYAAMRLGKLLQARAAFDRALALQEDSYDALSGRGMLAFREGDVGKARTLFARALQLVPGDSVSRAYLARLPVAVDTSPLPPHPRPAATVTVAMTGKRRFEVPDGVGGFRPLWIKAVNIGAALPGRHPSEFPPDDGTYEQWLALVDSMGANAVRVYTIHPPHFYRALAAWNTAHSDRPLWLIHGVWTEPPPGAQEEQYDDSAWVGQFHDEMRRVVNLIHGHAIIERRPGHAAGRYEHDVSRWTLGYIIGREWEPYSVVAFARSNSAHSAYHGRYVEIDGGNAVETWLAEVSDYMVTYEMELYNTQRPLAYTNWPTLDPLVHLTEASREEEARWQLELAEVLPESSREYDNDAIGLDAVKMHATRAYPAGVFASYHAYPYYPDFMVLDPGYLQANAPEGPSAYFGYLRELVEHHGDMPVVISEYGVPSSRGNAHMQPQGWNHGGHSESDQARIDARLTRDIHAAGAAGAGLFALIDEWFKKNWVVIDFEQPLERNRLWLNALDAEQNYGVIAMRAGSRDSVITIDGAGDDWRDRGRWYVAPNDTTLPVALRLRDFRVIHDEAYVYLRLLVGAIDWSRGRYLVGISTIGDSLGDSRLPYTGLRSPAGLEFVVDLRGPEDSRLLVDSPYNLYKRVPIRGSQAAATIAVYNRPFHSVPNDDGIYDTLRVTINRRRIGRDGTVYPERTDDRNRLLFAQQQQTTLADWYADSTTGTIEMRIPWGMLHVLDPSSHLVLQGRPQARDPEGATTPGFRFVVQSYDPRDPQQGGDVLPHGVRTGHFGEAPLWRWPGWEEPTWHAELKPLFSAMREVFTSIPDAPAAHISRKPND